jgi:predicted tellurium resistance membrane protein TerC
MTPLFSFDSLVSLFTLTILEIVLGIDNVIFVSIIMNKMPGANQRLNARRVWMIAGIAIRVGLLLLLTTLVTHGNKELFGFNFNARHIGFTLRNIIMFGGGLFLLYKTAGEIHDKFDIGNDEDGVKPKTVSFTGLVVQIILVDTVFSFDSIITAVGLANHVEVMMVAVVIAMILMFFFSGAISSFIHKYPSLKMLALSFLLMVGFSLFFEGLEPIHGGHIDKGYIYFAMAFSFVVELLNIKLRKKTKEQKMKQEMEKKL